MGRERIIEFLGDDWVRMQEYLKSGLGTDVPLLSEINGGILAHPGKMLRPMTALLLGRACGGTTEATVRYAAVSEMLHNATLMHDDVADESPQRRGRPTLRSLIGPNSAVLVGDFWLAKSVDLMVRDHIDQKVVEAYSRTLVHLAEGEMLQMQMAESGLTGEQEYYRIIYCKTASLFESVGYSAAVSTGAPEEYVRAAVAYSKALGMAFQIKDDILDYCGEMTGKPVGADLKERKITLPLLGAMKNVPGQESRIREMVRQAQDHPGYCSEIHAFVMDNGGIEYASRELGKFIAEAVSALGALPGREAAGMLAEIAEYNAVRDL